MENIPNESCREKLNTHVGFEVLAAVVMKTSIIWDIKPCSPSKVYRHFGEILLATCFHSDFLLGLFLHPEDGGDMFLRKVG
jgi:hypothetical protein